MATTSFEVGSVEGKIKTLEDHLGTLYMRKITHAGKGKFKIVSDIGSSTNFGRQAFFLFSVAGGSPWAAIMKVGTESSATLAATYENVAGSVITAATASAEGGKVAGTFTMASTRYDTSCVLSTSPFSVEAIA